MAGQISNFENHSKIIQSRQKPLKWSLVLNVKYSFQCFLTTLDKFRLILKQKIVLNCYKFILLKALFSFQFHHSLLFSPIKKSNFIFNKTNYIILLCNALDLYQSITKGIRNILAFCSVLYTPYFSNCTRLTTSTISSELVIYKILWLFIIEPVSKNFSIMLTTYMLNHEMAMLFHYLAFFYPYAKSSTTGS